MALRLARRGFRSGDIIILEDGMKTPALTPHIVTDDGSNGRAALVRRVLKAIDAGNRYDAVIANRPIDYDDLSLRDHPSAWHQDNRFQRTPSRLIVPACAAAVLPLAARLSSHALTARTLMATSLI